MGLCGQFSAVDLSDDCVRSSWITILLTGLVCAFCLFSLPIPLPEWAQNVRDTIVAPFRTYMPLHEAEALDVGDREHLKAADADAEVEVKQIVSLWRTVTLVFVGLVEAIAWICVGSYHFVTKDDSSSTATWLAIQSFLLAFAWIYTVVRPISHPAATPPYDLFAIYILQLVGEALKIGGLLYGHDVLGIPLPSAPVLVAHVLNTLAISGVLSVVLGMPLALPSNKVNKADIGRSVSPEDYTSLFGWITFSWVYPLIKKGKHTTLNESDVWGLSPSLQSRPIFIKFMNIQTSSLLKRIFIANSLDLILDFVISTGTVCLEFFNPFFLNRILSSIDHEVPTPADRSRAYIYAVLMFLCSLLRSQCDLQHLWVGRRAATRVRSELMARIYEKALKRKDLSGSGNLEKEAKDVNENDKKDEKSADTGKIVNLMAVDANRISMTISAFFMLYNAPFEIIIGLAYLYQLLGVSAFAGLVVLIAGWPLNSYLTNRSMAIYKGNAEARDKRMSVLSELIGAIKFIKFFAWEDRWIDRIMEQRQKEIQWMVKARVNSVLFYILWQATPILVSIISFLTYVLLGHELTVAVAFTAIALFAMIRTPLNTLPSFVVQLAQSKVALDRIANYLDEEEVDDQVSSLQPKQSGSVHEGLGFEGATLHWNEARGNGKTNDVGHANGIDSTTSGGNGAPQAQSELSDTATISEMDRKFELRDVSLKFPEGELTVVTGPTASGKTALLMAVLGEMTLVSGRILMTKDSSHVDEHGHMHAISYAAQTPWLRHQSIKDNILFGYPLDEERYENVVEACALKPDLEILEDGDKTEIGAKGVSLSGGQKARVALARAVYARTKYVLLDDPLSAVDSHTSRFLYEKLLRGPLLFNRTVVLVTHHVDLVLPSAHYLVRMLDGRVDTHGTIKELRAQGVLDNIKQEAEVDAHKEELVASAEEAAIAAVETDEESAKKKPRKLVEDEHRETGSVKWGIYKKYLQASSYWVWVLLAFFVILNQILGVGEKFWIRIWGEAYRDKSFTSAHWLQTLTPFRVSTASELELSVGQHAYWSRPLAPVTSYSGGHWLIHLPNAFEHPLFYVGVYAAIGVLNALVSVTATIVQYTGALKASRLLFKQLLVTVVRATFRFHDTTPQGRLLNRFGKDIETIDSSLAGSLQNVNSSLANFFASVITIAVVFPFFLLPAAVLGFLYRELAIGYLNTGRDLRRMESNSRSPIFSDFGEILEGIVTVRAFSAEKRFLDNLHKKINLTTQMWYAFWMTNRWLFLSFDTLGSLAVLITALFSISNIDNGAGLAGICITSALSFTMSVYWACRFWTGLELDLNSVERIVEYLELPQEPPAIIESARPPAYWPSNSRNDALISVENLSVRYSPELPAVIQDVSFTLKSGERVGLLGRTGSGKSTLAMSILRFVDPSDGRILIDGIDISTIGVHDLRSRITFIPQDAALFSGTLRDNLDPFGEYTDAECMDVLYRVHMITRSQPGSQRTSRAPSGTGTPDTSRPSSVRSIQREDSTSTLDSVTEVDAKSTISLDTQVSTGGMNFSQGQRQLIAMARALLRRSSIIILDEATSSIDFATDAKIQTAIREEFSDSLLLTVAHRLRTVIDYDRLVVLDKGRVVEFDTPLRLIQKEDGIFRNMCLKSGTFAELEALARVKDGSR